MLYLRKLKSYKQVLNTTFYSCTFNFIKTKYANEKSILSALYKSFVAVVYFYD